mmetsp:Transcript_11772/g.32452  ORF Transcript_11772/g.32452 Transcript_11772/m.32452 type:complete len:146 (-) Transcript_11772:250-687(-)
MTIAFVNQRCALHCLVRGRITGEPLRTAMTQSKPMAQTNTEFHVIFPLSVCLRILLALIKELFPWGVQHFPSLTMSRQRISRSDHLHHAHPCSPRTPRTPRKVRSTPTSYLFSEDWRPVMIPISTCEVCHDSHRNTQLPTIQINE